MRPAVGGRGVCLTTLVGTEGGKGEDRFVGDGIFSDVSVAEWSCMSAQSANLDRLLRLREDVVFYRGAVAQVEGQVSLAMKKSPLVAR